MGHPLAEAADRWELTSVGVWNQTQLFWKQQVFLSTESSVLDFFLFFWSVMLKSTVDKLAKIVFCPLKAICESYCIVSPGPYLYPMIWSSRLNSTVSRGRHEERWDILVNSIFSAITSIFRTTAIYDSFTSASEIGGEAGSAPQDRFH